MTPSETVTAFIDALEAKDFDAAIALISDECEYDNVPMGKVHGPVEIRGLLEPMLGAATTVDWKVYRQAADGPTVFNDDLIGSRCRSGGWTCPSPAYGRYTAAKSPYGGTTSTWRHTATNSHHPDADREPPRYSSMTDNPDT